MFVHLSTHTLKEEMLSAHKYKYLTDKVYRYTMPYEKLKVHSGERESLLNISLKVVSFLLSTSLSFGIELGQDATATSYLITKTSVECFTYKYSFIEWFC